MELGATTKVVMKIRTTKRYIGLDLNRPQKHKVLIGFAKLITLFHNVFTNLIATKNKANLHVMEVAPISFIVMKPIVGQTHLCMVPLRTSHLDFPKPI
jgi:hypothetical protein